MARQTNYLQLALDLRRGSWLIKDPDILMPVVDAFFARQGGDLSIPEYQLSAFQLARGGNAVGRADEASKADRVIVVPVHGAMTKYDTCETYGSTTIAARMLEHLEDKKVAGFVLDVDSPGGASNAVAPLTEAIAKARAAGKPVVAHCDSCYSAAYWVASQCDAVFADNALSGFGSIGAYAQFLDDRLDRQTGHRVITIYAPESTEKNLAYREALEGRTEKMQQQLSKLVQSFHAAVKAGRPDLKTEEAGVLAGADFPAAEAVAVGLADGMASLEECIKNVFIRAEFNNS